MTIPIICIIGTQSNKLRHSTQETNEEKGRIVESLSYRNSQFKQSKVIGTQQ